MRKLIYILLILYLHVFIVGAQNSLPASINSDTVLTIAASPYLIEQNLTISDGVTLEIDPGVRFILTPNVSITNNGRLILNGNEQNRIEFTTGSTGERWKYINNNGSVYASFVTIKNATRFITSYGDTVIINNCSVTDSYGTVGDDCIGIHNASKVTIINCTIIGNPAAGKTDALDLDGISNDTISGNYISGFSDDGIDIGTNSQGIVITYNTINQCDMAVSVGENSTAEVSNNLLTYCSAGIQSHFGSVVTAVQNTLYGNIVGLRAFHNTSEETSGGTINISNSIISNCLSQIFTLKDNSVVSFNYCLTDSMLLAGTGNITGLPSFVNVDENNFNLTSGSIAIDAGDPDNDNDGINYLSDPDDRDPDGSRLDLGYSPFFKSQIKLIEISPSNLCLTIDDSGEYSDWFLINNLGDSVINLKNHYFSDNPANPTKHQILGDITLNPGDTAIFRADKNPIAGINHLTFKLSGEGEYLSISNPEGYMMDEKSFPRVPVNYIYKRIGLTDEWVYYTLPQFEDTTIYQGLSPDPEFSDNGGKTVFPFSVTIASPWINDSVFYSEDGADPVNGMLFEEPISIQNALTLRAITKQTGYFPSYIHSRVFFPENAYNLPLVSISTNEEHLYGTTGIYTNYSKGGPLWERPASVSYYDNSKFFSAITGIRIQGGNSVFMPKKSFRLHFRGGYGSSRLSATPFTGGPPDFKNLVLRSGYDDDISAYSGTMLRDPFSAELWKMLGETATESTWTVLLLNNNYWGIYNLRESINEYFVEDHLGFENFDLVRFQKWGPDLKYGTFDEWNSLVNYFDTTDFTRPEVYQEVSSFMDLNSFLNLLALVHCTQFRSWTWGAFTFKPAGGKWQWTIWDTDRSYNTLSWNGFIEYANTTNEKWPNFIPQKLIRNEQFKNDLINRNCDLLNSLLIPENAISVYDSLVSILTPEMDNEFERWNPDNRYRWDINNEAIREFLRNRPGYLYNQMKTYFSISDTVEVTLHIIGDGRVKLNSLMISDTLWKGTYMAGIPITLEARPLAGSSFIEWADIGNHHQITIDPEGNRHITAVFDTSSLANRKPIVINEIMYHPAQLTSSEWVELYNPNEFSISLDKFEFTDGGTANYFIIPENTIIDPADFLVLPGNISNYISEFSNTNIVNGSFNEGVYGFSLKNSGESLYLKDSSGNIEDYILYSDQMPWPEYADGYGPSLQLISPELDNNDPANWFASLSVLSTPGTHNSSSAIRKKETLNQLDISLFPNPVEETIYINLSSELSSEIYMSIFSLTGSKVAEKIVSVQENNKFIIWEHGLNKPGAYIIKLQFIHEYGTFNKSLLLIYSGAR